MNYIFKPPAQSYDIKFTFEGISEFIAKGRNETRRKLGSTLELRAGFRSEAFSDVAVVRLYDTDLAYINRDGSIEVLEAVNRHGSQATTYWLQKILTDNHAPGLVARLKGKYAQAGRKWTGTEWTDRYPGSAARAQRLA